MRKEGKDFVTRLELLNYPESDKSELATRLLYLASKKSTLRNSSRYTYNAQDNFIELNQEIKKIYDSFDYSYLGKKDFKELCNYCISKFRTGNFINIELYMLIEKLLDLKSTDLLLHVNAPNESFLLHAIESIKTGPLKLGTYVLPDNLKTSDLISMRLELNETNYTIIDDIEAAFKFNPNKIFINPMDITLDKTHKYSTKANSFWDDLLNLTKLITKKSRIVALVPNVMLSNSVDKEKKEELLNGEFVEGIISLPLRYYSNSSKVETSLLILSKDNKSIKILDINSLFTTDDLKFAKLDSITDYIYERYKDNFTVVEAVDLIRGNSNLLLSNIITPNTYQGMRNLNKLSSIANVTKSIKKTKVDFKELIDQTGESSYVLLSSNDIDDGIIDYRRLTRIMFHPSFKKYLVKKGDVLITNKSSKSKLTVIECENLKIIPTGSMIIVSPHENKLDGNYLKMFFESEKGANLLSKVQRGQRTNTINPIDIEKLQVPYMDYDKQLSLVEKYKKKQSEINKKKTEIENIKKKIEKIINTGEFNYDNE